MISFIIALVTIYLLIGILYAVIRIMIVDAPWQLFVLMIIFWPAFLIE